MIVFGGHIASEMASRLPATPVTKLLRSNKEPRLHANKTRSIGRVVEEGLDEPLSETYS